MDTEEKSLSEDQSDLSDAQQKEVQKSDPLRSLFDFVELFALAACLILLIFTLFARLTVVDGSSMDNTLKDGQRLIISDILYTPKCGDIVVIQSPDVLGGKAIVKRIIATEGQRVEIYADGVYVYNPDGSGGKLEELDGSLGYKVSFDPSPYYTYRRQSFTVGEGEVFVMGDHRSVSEDSRSFGTVDARTILGKAYLRISPLSEFGTLY